MQVGQGGRLEGERKREEGGRRGNGRRKGDAACLGLLHLPSCPCPCLCSPRRCLVLVLLASPPLPWELVIEGHRDTITIETKPVTVGEEKVCFLGASQQHAFGKWDVEPWAASSW